MAVPATNRGRIIQGNSFIQCVGRSVDGKALVRSKLPFCPRSVNSASKNKTSIMLGQAQCPTREFRRKRREGAAQSVRYSPRAQWLKQLAFAGAYVMGEGALQQPFSPEHHATRDKPAERGLEFDENADLIETADLPEVPPHLGSLCFWSSEVCILRWFHPAIRRLQLVSLKAKDLHNVGAALHNASAGEELNLELKSLVTPAQITETFPIGLANRRPPISELEFGCDGFFGVRKSACSAGVACHQIQPALPLRRHHMRLKAAHYLSVMDWHARVQRAASQEAHSFQFVLDWLTMSVYIYHLTTG
ncbi:hypothetical protein C8J57DRAFT_1460136 [Mycena rebaudengoi]|nr:hypothetical protein C8J57DRAFT_1460136 [Mycena rebaudengoi]